MNEPLGTRFAAALAYVVHLHAEQRRKGTDVPYVAHLLAVAALVIEDAAATDALREDEAIAALLHDTAEDQGGEPRLADIAERFGPRVAHIVRACSDSLADDGEKAPWRARKEAHLAHLATETDTGVLRVALADKVNNARAVLADYRVLGEPFWQRFNRDADTPWYYRRLAEIFTERLPGSPLTAELVEAVSDLEAEIAANRAASSGSL